MSSNRVSTELLTLAQTICDTDPDVERKASSETGMSSPHVYWTREDSDSGQTISINAEMGEILPRRPFDETKVASAIFSVIDSDGETSVRAYWQSGIGEAAPPDDSIGEYVLDIFRRLYDRTKVH